jgi:hypothetical protein
MASLWSVEFMCGRGLSKSPCKNVMSASSFTAFFCATSRHRSSISVANTEALGSSSLAVIARAPLPVPMSAMVHEDFVSNAVFQQLNHALAFGSRHEHVCVHGEFTSVKLNSSPDVCEWNVLRSLHNFCVQCCFSRGAKRLFSMRQRPGFLTPQFITKQHKCIQTGRFDSDRRQLLRGFAPPRLQVHDYCPSLMRLRS